MKIQRLRDIADLIGREGLSQLVIEAVEEFDDSYKGAMRLAGELSVIAKMATFDSYWDEKTNLGRQRMEGKLLNLGCKRVIK